MKIERRVLWSVLIGVGIIAVTGLAIYAAIKAAPHEQHAAPSFRNSVTSLGRTEDVRLASQPIKWATNSLTIKDAQKRRRVFRERQYLAGYKERGDRAGACDATSVAYLQLWIEANYGKPPTNGPSVTELGDQLAGNTNCTDPLVLTVAGATGIEVHEDVRRLERALAGFAHAKYRAYPQFFATLSLTKHLGGDPGRIGTLHGAALVLFEDCFKDGSFLPEDQADLAEIFVEGYGNNFFKGHGEAICRIVKAQGKRFEWLALMLDGEYHIIQAWDARGSGYSDSVSEKGWQAFTVHLTGAQTSLTAAWKLKPEIPLAASRMVYVALGGKGLAEARLWFDRAVWAQVDEPEAWKNFRWALRPRWHGSLDSMKALGIQALETRRFDTDVPLQLFEIAGDLEGEMQPAPGRHIYGRKDIWPNLQKMYEGYIAEHSKTGTDAGWRSAYTVVAYLAGKYDVARGQLESNHWTVFPYNKLGWGRELSLLELEVAARTGPATNQVRQAETAFRGRTLAEAARGFQEVEKSDDERTRSFAQHRLATIAVEQALDAGDWVNFLPERQDDPNWVIAFGKVKPIDSQNLEVESATQGHMLFSRARMPNEFEVKGEFEVVRSSNRSFQAGLVLGLPDFERSTWFGYRVKRNDTEGDVTAFARGWSSRQVYAPVKLDDKTNSFLFTYRRGIVDASVNGQSALRNASLRSSVTFAANEFHLGLGAYVDSNLSTIRYHNVQVKRISKAAEPTPDKKENEKR